MPNFVGSCRTRLLTRVATLILIDGVPSLVAVLKTKRYYGKLNSVYQLMDIRIAYPYMTISLR